MSLIIMRGGDAQYNPPTNDTNHSATATQIKGQTYTEISRKIIKHKKSSTVISISRRYENITKRAPHIYQRKVHFIVEIQISKGESVKIPLSIILTVEASGRDQAKKLFEKDMKKLNNQIQSASKKVFTKYKKYSLNSKTADLKKEITAKIVSKKPLDKKIENAIKIADKTKLKEEEEENTNLNELGNVLNGVLADLTEGKLSADQLDQTLDFLDATLDTVATFSNDELKNKVIAQMRYLATRILETAETPKAIQLNAKILRSYILDEGKTEYARTFAKAAGIYTDLRVVEATLQSLREAIEADELTDKEINQVIDFGILTAQSLEGYPPEKSKAIYQLLTQLGHHLEESEDEVLSARGMLLKSVSQHSQTTKLEQQLAIPEDDKPINLLFAFNPLTKNKKEQERLTKKLAHDINSITYNTYKHIPHYELGFLPKADKQIKLKALFENFDRISHWVQTTIMTSSSPDEAMKIWLDVANKLLESKNYYGAAAIVATLNKSHIERLSDKSKTAKPPIHIEKFYETTLNNLNELFNPEGSFANYRNQTKLLDQTGETYYPFPVPIASAYTMASENSLKTDEQLKVLMEYLDVFSNIPRPKNLNKQTLQTTMLSGTPWDDTKAHEYSRTNWERPSPRT